MPTINFSDRSAGFAPSTGNAAQVGPDKKLTVTINVAAGTSTAGKTPSSIQFGETSDGNNLELSAISINGRALDAAYTRVRNLQFVVGETRFNTQQLNVGANTVEFTVASDTPSLAINYKSWM